MRRFCLVLAVLVTVLVLGLAFVGCDNGTTEEPDRTTKFEGRWAHGNPSSGPARFTFTEDTFVFTGTEGSTRGTFTFDATNISFTANNGSSWITTYVLTDTSITFTAGNGGWPGLWYGTFNKQ